MNIHVDVVDVVDVVSHYIKGHYLAIQLKNTCSTQHKNKTTKNTKHQPRASI
jgi:hypothetical protein